MRVESVGYQVGEGLVAHEGGCSSVDWARFFPSCVILFHSSGARGLCGVDNVDCFFDLSHWWSSAFLLGCFSFSTSPPGDSLSARHGSAMRAVRGRDVPARGGGHAATARQGPRNESVLQIYHATRFRTPRARFTLHQST